MARLLKLDNVSKSFGAFELLEDISLGMEEGARLGIVGANGCGKTTLLKIIAGIEEYDRGSIYLAPFTDIEYLDQMPMKASSLTLMEEMLTVFEPLIKMEEEIRALEHKMEGSYDEELLTRYGELSEKFGELGGYRYMSDIRGVLTGLSFTQQEYDKPVSVMSGGERTRAALGKMLLKKPRLMLLDEPTNHLDLNAIRFLENYIKSCSSSFIVVSHDRYFMDEICTDIVEIEQRSALSFRGNYSDYRSKKTQLNDIMEKQYTLQQREIKRLQGIIDELKSFNREKSVRAARSKEKQLERIKLVTSPFRQSKMHVTFSAQRQSGNDVVKAEELAKSFDGETLFSSLNLDIKRGQRVGIIGPNGCGKTTLLKIIAGMERADDGEVILGSKVSVGYYDQNVSRIHGEKDVLTEVYDDFPYMDIGEIRNILGAFLFKGDDVFKKCSSLSGGEKARVMLAKLMLGHDNLLLLDEPTNHLDTDSKEILEDALDEYDATVIFVSHDRYFINSVATNVLSFEDGDVNLYEGGYDDYLSEKERLKELARLKEEGLTKPLTKTAQEKNLKKEKEARKESSRIKGRMKEIEKEITLHEEEIALLEEKMGLPETYKDPALAKEISSRYEELKEKIDLLFAEWDELSQ